MYLENVSTRNFRYFVIQPFASKTARIRFGSDKYNDFMQVGVRDVQLSRTLPVRSCQAFIWDTRFGGFIFTVLHTFSMTFKSGDWGGQFIADTVFSFPATCLSRCMHWCIVFLEDIRWLTDSFLFILGNYWPKICVQYFNVLPRVDVAFYRCQSTNRIKRYIPPEHPA